MYYGCIKFSSLPHIGFAHHFYTDNDKYSYTYTGKNISLEVVYVNSGGIEAQLYGEKVYAPEGSVFVLFRHLPITIEAVGGKNHSHSTVQAELNLSFTLLTESQNPPPGRLILPFVTLPCPETEHIRKELCDIISDMGTSESDNSFRASLKLLGILETLDKTAHKSSFYGDIPSDTSPLSKKVKRYINGNLHRKITLDEIASIVHKTPNHVNFVFKKENGITITQFINSVKAREIAKLITKSDMTFAKACETVGITNSQYGKKLFVRHMGVTPEIYVKGNIHKKRATPAHKSRA